MTNGAPEDLIPSLAHEDPLVRSYTARLLGLDAEAGEVEQYLRSSLVQGTAPLRRVAARAMGKLVADWTLEPLSASWATPIRQCAPRSPGLWAGWAMGRLCRS